MKIIYFTTALTSGGAERVLCRLADHFADLGHDVVIVSMRSKFQVLPSNSKIKIIDLKINKKNPLSIIRAFLKAWIFTNKFKPDVIHSHMYHANIFARILNIVNPPNRLICTAHSSIEGGVLSDILYRITDNIPYISTNVSQAACNSFFERKASKPSRMISTPNAINISRFSSKYTPHRGPCRILTVCTLRPEKNIEMLLRAAASALTILEDNLEIWIAGDGTERKALEELSNKLNIGKFVTFFGEFKKPEDLMSRSTLFVSTSNYEGFGLAVAEAMAVGIPVIATDSGGVSEVMGETGYLIPVGDEEALSNKIIDLLEYSDEKLRSIGSLGTKRISENFLEEPWLKSWKEIYTERLYAEDN